MRKQAIAVAMAYKSIAECLADFDMRIDSGRRLSLRVTIIAVLHSSLFAAPAYSLDQFELTRNRASAAVDSRKAGIASIAIAVAQDGRIIWEHGFGLADIERGVPATAHTPYSLASVSKPITATAVMMLVEEGRIELDDPINDYLEGSKLSSRPESVSAATVCRIANHTSGLSTHVNFYYADEQMSRPPMEETIRRYGKLIGIPGERHVYSNLGYGILGYVVGRVSGLTYAGYLEKAVFQPLGMSHSSVGAPTSGKPAPAARYDRHGERLPSYNFDHPGASAIYSSAHDLALFGMSHMAYRRSQSKALLSISSMESMRYPDCSEGEHGAYGIGWRIDTTLGLEVVSHSGGMPGVSTLLVLLPDRNIAIAVLTNRFGRPGANSQEAVRWPIANSILRELLDDWPLDYEPKRPSTGKGTGFPESFVGQWKGTVDTYSSPLPIELDFSESGAVMVSLDEQSPRIVKNVGYADGWLEGAFSGSLNTDELNNRRPYSLRLFLRLDDPDTLRGSTSAVSTGTERFYFYLPHWTVIHRAEAQSSK